MEKAKKYIKYKSVGYDNAFAYKKFTEKNMLLIKIKNLLVDKEYVQEFYDTIKPFYKSFDKIIIDVRDCIGGYDYIALLFLSIFSSKNIKIPISYYFPYTKYNKSQMNDILKVYFNMSIDDCEKLEKKIGNLSYQVFHYDEEDMKKNREFLSEIDGDYKGKVYVAANNNTWSAGAFLVYVAKKLKYKIIGNEKYIAKSAWGPGPSILDILPNTKILFNYDTMISEKNINGIKCDIIMEDL